MCYNNCEYFHFNPMTGEDRCSKPRHAVCQDELAEMEAEDKEEYLRDSEIDRKIEEQLERRHNK